MADSDNSIKVQIVLDNGSIQNGFIKLEQQAAETGKAVEKSLSDKAADGLKSKIESLAGGFSEFGIVATAAGAAFAAFGFAAKKALDQTLEGERLLKIEMQFKALSDQAGLSAEVLSGKFFEAVNGLSSKSDSLQALNEGLVTLGAKASQLPEIFELARKATVVFGGDAVENFRNIEQAIATGNVRGLRQLGLKIDQIAAEKKYADSIGVTVSALNESGKQQAILNAVTEVGAKRFAAINPNVDNATTALKRFDVALKELSEESAKNAAKNFGDLFKTIINGASDAAIAINHILNPDSTSAIEANLIRIKQRISEIKQNGGESTSGGELYFLNAQLAALSKEIQLRKDVGSIEEEEARKRGDRQSAAQKDAISGINSGVDQKVILEQRLAFNNQLNELDKAAGQASLVNEQARIDSLDGIDDQIVQNKFLLSQRLLQIGQEQAAAENAEIKKLNDDKILDEESRGAALNAIKSRYESLALTETQKNIDKEKQLQKLKMQNLSTILGQIATLTQNSSGTLFEIGKAAAIAQATMDGYVAVQGAFKFGNTTGGPALGYALAALVGAAAAANVAKIAQLQPGGGGASSSFDSGAPTPVTVEPPVTSSTPPEVAKQGPKIDVTIQGNVFDTEDTGLRIVDIINKAYDQQGAVITGNV